MTKQNYHDSDSSEADYDEEEELLVGDYNDLEVVRLVEFGLYLDSEYGDILLPKGKVPPDVKEGDILHVFIYVDSEQRLIATTDDPFVTVDHCTLLEVKDVNKYAAFVDWGIDNQLLVPFREQVEEMLPGKKYMVYVYLDDVSDRLVGSTRLDRFFHNNECNLLVKQKVDLYVFQQTSLGFKALINGKFIGLLYASELDIKIETGDTIQGYIKNIREDGKIDLTLKQPGFDRVAATPDLILAVLEKNHGFLSLNDKSSPDEIRSILNISKGDFKKAVGMLLKQKKIAFKKGGIALQ